MISHTFLTQHDDDFTLQKKKKSTFFVVKESPFLLGVYLSLSIGGFVPNQTLVEAKVGNVGKT